MWSLVHWLPKSSFPVVRERTFFIEKGWGVGRGFGWEGGGGAGLWMGGSLVNFLQIGKVKPVYSQPGEGHSFFGKEKITPFRFYFVYTSKATSQD